MPKSSIRFKVKIVKFLHFYVNQFGHNKFLNKAKKTERVDFKFYMDQLEMDLLEIKTIVQGITYSNYIFLYSIIFSK